MGIFNIVKEGLVNTVNDVKTEIKVNRALERAKADAEVQILVLQRLRQEKAEAKAKAKKGKKGRK